MSVFKNIIGDICKGAGTVLSFIPGIGPLVGPAVMSVGGALTSGRTGSIDNITVATNQLVASQQAATDMLNAGTGSLGLSGISTWIRNNIVIVLAGSAAAALVYLVISNKRR